MTRAHWHNVPGQLNRAVLDVDSDVTNFGKHNRLVVFRGIGDESDIITIREDLRDLPMSTEADRQRVAKRPGHRLHPRGSRLVHESSEPYTGRQGECIEHTYRIR